MLHPIPSSCYLWVSPLVWREFKSCDVVEKSREAQGSGKELLEISPSYPLQLNILEYSVPASREQDKGSCEQVQLHRLRSHGSVCGACLAFQPC